MTAGSYRRLGAYELGGPADCSVFGCVLSGREGTRRRNGTLRCGACGLRCCVPGKKQLRGFGALLDLARCEPCSMWRKHAQQGSCKLHPSPAGWEARSGRGHPGWCQVQRLEVGSAHSPFPFLERVLDLLHLHGSCLSLFFPLPPNALSLWANCRNSHVSLQLIFSLIVHLPGAICDRKPWLSQYQSRANPLGVSFSSMYTISIN